MTDPGRSDTRDRVLCADVNPPSVALPFGNPEDLPGLSIITWEEFQETPSLLTGLFERRKQEVTHNEQVNVFIHGASMEPATIGTPSGDGFSWTIIVDTYNHLMAVHSRLTDRISLLLIQLLLPKGNQTVPDLWVIAVNPHNDTIRSELQKTLSSAATAFLSHRDFRVVLDLNCRVQRWCSSVLKTSCKVCGGRLVITNKITESTSCSWMGKVPFSVLCLPVTGLRKLFYKFRRMSGYDIIVCFQAEELTLCSRTGQQKQRAEGNKTHLEHFSAKKAHARIKKNLQAVEVATQTSNSDLESQDDDGDENDEASLQAEETDVQRVSPGDVYTKDTARECASLAKSRSDCDSARRTCRQTVTWIQSTGDTTVHPSGPSFYSFNRPSVSLFDTSFPPALGGAYCTSGSSVLDRKPGGSRGTPTNDNFAIKRGRHSLVKPKCNPTVICVQQARGPSNGNIVYGNTWLVEDKRVVADLCYVEEFRQESKWETEGTSSVLEDALETTDTQSQSNTRVGRDFETLVRESDLMVDLSKKSAAVPFKTLKSIDKVNYTPVKRLKDKKAAKQGRPFFRVSEQREASEANVRNETSWPEAKRKHKQIDKKRSSETHVPGDKIFETRLLFHEHGSSLKDADSCDVADIKLEDVTSDLEDIVPLGPTSFECRTNSEHSAETTVKRDVTGVMGSQVDADEDKDEWVNARNILADANGTLKGTGAQKSRQLFGVDSWKRWGLPNDSRRRYLALNSMRRKDHILALQADVRRQNRSSNSGLEPFISNPVCLFAEF